jgi:hypothetical protein
LSFNQAQLPSVTLEEAIFKTLNDLYEVSLKFEKLFEDSDHFEILECQVPLITNDRQHHTDHPLPGQFNPNPVNLKLSMSIKNMYNGNFSIVHIGEKGLAALASPKLEVTDQILCINNFPVVGWCLKYLIDELGQAKLSGDKFLRLNVKRFKYIPKNTNNQSQQVIPAVQEAGPPIPTKPPITNISHKIDKPVKKPRFLRKKSINKNRNNQCKSIGDIEEQLNNNFISRNFSDVIGGYTRKKVIKLLKAKSDDDIKGNMSDT